MRGVDAFIKGAELQGIIDLGKEGKRIREIAAGHGHDAAGAGGYHVQVEEKMDVVERERWILYKVSRALQSLFFS